MMNWLRYLQYWGRIQLLYASDPIQFTYLLIFVRRNVYFITACLDTRYFPPKYPQQKYLFCSCAFNVIFLNRFTFCWIFLTITKLITQKYVVLPFYLFFSCEKLKVCYQFLYFLLGLVYCISRVAFMIYDTLRKKDHCTKLSQDLSFGIICAQASCKVFIGSLLGDNFDVKSLFLNVEIKSPGYFQPSLV